MRSISKNYSALYLFLIADMTYSATVFPMFWALYSQRFGETSSLVSNIAVHVSGTLFSPKPDLIIRWLTNNMWEGKFIVRFGAALRVSVIVSLALTVLAKYVKTRSMFEFSNLKEKMGYIANN